MNEQSLEQANRLLAAAASSTGTGQVVSAPLAELGRQVELPGPLALARAVRALVSRGRLESDNGSYRLLDARPLEVGEPATVAPRKTRRGRRGRGAAEEGSPDGLPTYSDLGRAVVDRLIEMARETAALSELTILRRELREERSARVHAEERATESHHRARELESRLQMAEENLRRVMGVIRQKQASARPTDPEAQALLAILRASGGDESPEAAEESGSAG